MILNLHILLIIWITREIMASPIPRNYALNIRENLVSNSNRRHKTRHQFMVGDRTKNIQIKNPGRGGEVIGVTSVKSNIPYYVFNYDYEKNKISDWPNPHKVVSVKIPTDIEKQNRESYSASKNDATRAFSENLSQQNQKSGIRRPESAPEKPQWVNEVKAIETAFLLSGRYDGVLPEGIETDDDDFWPVFGSGAGRPNSSKDKFQPIAFSTPSGDFEIYSKGVENSAGVDAPIDFARNNTAGDGDGRDKNATVGVDGSEKWATSVSVIVLVIQILLIVLLIVLVTVGYSLIKYYRQQFIKTRIINEYLSGCNRHKYFSGNMVDEKPNTVVI